MGAAGLDRKAQIRRILHVVAAAHRTFLKATSRVRITTVEKDWSKRFDNSDFECWWHDCLYFAAFILFILLLPVSLGWMILVIGSGFHDSLGSPRNSDFAGHVRVYSWAIGPMVLTALLGYSVARLRRKRRRARKSTRL